jgi:hypothetical protein
MIYEEFQLTQAICYNLQSFEKCIETLRAKLSNQEVQCYEYVFVPPPPSNVELLGLKPVQFEDQPTLYWGQLGSQSTTSYH